MRALAQGLLVAGWLVLAGCGEDEVIEAVDTTAVDIDGHECAACGMIVREQPSPRGQVVHRDGTHAYFCSLADMHAYLMAPSSHGEVLATYVEALSVSDGPPGGSTAQEPWVEAGAASFVLGVERRNIMGRPVLSYATREAAEQMAERLGGRVVDYVGLGRELDADLE